MAVMKRSSVVLAAAVALALSSCGGSGEESSPEPTRAETSDGGASDPEVNGADGVESVGTAIDTAESEADGTAYEVSLQDGDGTWEVLVAVGDGSVEVTVSADGSNVVTTEDEQVDPGDLTALSSATTTLGDAIESGLAAVDDPTFDEAGLADVGGTYVWEVSVSTPRFDEVDVAIDLETGQVVGTQGS